jgi:hypothetical protein
MITTIMRTRSKLALLLIFCSGATVAAADDSKANDFNFSFTVEGDLASKPPSGNLNSTADFRYTWQRRDRERSLRYDAINMKVKKDGVPVIESVINHSKFTGKAEGKPMDVSYRDAPAHMKKLMDETFGSPVCTVLVDASGKEMRRTVVDNLGARFLSNGGMIRNALFFHPPPPSKGEWQRDAEITVMGSMAARGTLRYDKKRVVEGKEEYEVHGTLANKEIKGPETFATRNLRYVIHGTHTYDPAIREWVGAKMTADVSFEGVDGEKVMATTKGTMTLKFKLLRNAGG